MALGDLTRQIAKEALLSATAPAPKEQPSQASTASENIGATIFNQIHAMQKALKEDEELVAFAHVAGERIRVHEIFLPSRHVAVVTGADPAGARTRVISAIDALQVVCKVSKTAPGAKPLRINLVAPKA